jgi:hypothetical protein
VTVLDLDLDFFSTHVFYHPAENVDQRARAAPWSIQRADSFLRHSCSLLPRTPGLVVEEHQDVYYVVENGKRYGFFESPNTWIHVDSHSDLCSGMALSKGALAKSISLGRECDLNSNSYLLALVLAGHVQELHMVYNSGSLPDFDPELLDGNDRCQFFSLQVVSQQIVFHRYVENEFVWNKPIDFAFLCLSSQYTNDKFHGIAKYIRATFIAEEATRAGRQK